MSGLIEISLSFSAMNTRMKAAVCLPEDLSHEGENDLKSVEKLFNEIDFRFNRFRKDNELYCLNNSAGKEFQVSKELYEILDKSLESARLTHGIFDPTILNYLVIAGYDQSFEALIQDRNSNVKNSVLTTHNWSEIVLNPVTHSVSLPAGCGLDLGGIAKGWTVDQATRILEKYQNFAIDAGGDIRVGGRRSDGRPWNIGIADPFNDKRDIEKIVLSRGAICTSTTLKRRWKLDGCWQHHIIDPRTGLPADSGLISVTVNAETAVLAETVSKTALILGPREGLGFIESQPRVRGMMITRERKIITSLNFPGKIKKNYSPK